jgi:hypothetical protein
MRFPQSVIEDGGTKNLDLGRWELRITITADGYKPQYAEIEFTVYQEHGSDKLSVGCHAEMGRAGLNVQKLFWTRNRKAE